MCKKNEATINITQKINGVEKRIHLCPSCAAKMGLGPDNYKNLQNMMKDFMGHGSFNDMFNDIFNDLGANGINGNFSFGNDPFIEGSFSDERGTPQLNVNSQIGINRAQNGEIRKKYQKLEDDEMNEILKNICGNDKKNGKKIDKDEEIKNLKERLNKLVKQEKYEEAAKVRDEIKKIEESL
jgi:protein arginine kinase activator